MPLKKAVRVFISYARRDAADVALHLRDHLAKAALEPWLDTARISGGAVWTKDIEQAIDTCDVALAILSGEHSIPGGQAAFSRDSGRVCGRKPGYQWRNASSHSSLSTRVRICSNRCAPRCPLHLLTLVHSLAHHLIDRRLDKAGSNSF